MATMTNITATCLTDRFGELEKKIDNHINQDATLDAAERDFRAHCNSLVETRQKEKEAAQKALRDEAERKEHRRIQRQIQEANLDKLLIRLFGSVSAVAVMSIFYTTGNMSEALFNTGFVCAAAYGVVNAHAYLRNN